jgi:hypothetical protein
MNTSQNQDELRRLKNDFEDQARKYPDLTFAVYLIDEEGSFSDVRFRRPNHAISLWQFMGLLTPETNIDEFVSFSHTKFGITNAEVSALGVIEGPDTDLFRRMATRAGSLLPEELIVQMTVLIMNNFANPDWLGKPFYVCNGDKLAAWLNLILIAVTSFQPSRFKNGKLLIDPFAASLAVFDHLLSGRGFGEQSEAQSPFANKKFRIALSFPGEKREIIEAVAHQLHERLPPVFYDKFFEAELAQPNLDLILQRIYHDNAELVVVFLGSDYEQKEYCGLEWRAIRDLIKKRKGDSIMFLRFDDAEISGLFSIDGYVDISNRSVSDVVDLICQRYGSRCSD